MMTFALLQDKSGFYLYNAQSVANMNHSTEIFFGGREVMLFAAKRAGKARDIEG